MPKYKNVYAKSFPREGRTIGLKRGGQHKQAERAFQPVMSAYKLFFIVQARDAGEHFAFKEFEGSAAAGGDVGHLIGKAELLRGRRAVAAADDGRRLALQVGESLCHGDGTFCQFGVFKDAHGAVPDDGLGVVQQIGEHLTGSGTDVQAHHIVGDIHGVHDLGFDVRIDGIGEGIGRNGVVGQNDMLAEFFGLGEHFLAIGEFFLVDEGSADFAALGLDEGISHAAADEEGVAFFEEVGDDVQFIGNLGAAQNGDEGVLGMFQRIGHDGEFLFDEESANGGFDQSLFNDRGRGGVAAVCGAERVVDIDVAIGREGFAEIIFLLGLALVETQVFEENAFAVLAGGDFGLCVGADDVVRESDLAAEQLVESVRNGFEAELFQIARGLLKGGLLGGFLLRFGQSVDLCQLLFIELDFFVEYVVRLTHVRAERDFRALVHQIFDGGQRALDAVFVGDDSVLHGDVEVASHEYLFAFDIAEISDCHFIHKLNSPCNNNFFSYFAFDKNILPFFLIIVKDICNLLCGCLIKKLFFYQKIKGERKVFRIVLP